MDVRTYLVGRFRVISTFTQASSQVFVFAVLRQKNASAFSIQLCWTAAARAGGRLWFENEVGKKNRKLVVDCIGTDVCK